ncbi:MAG: TlyA family RNA methyltransferase, partial [Clostridia bacterium]|nr:TlyA family RNA methyltransferase [Clostridia bacterium]
MRLDKFLADKFASRTKAAEAIERGLVKINGKHVSPSYDYKEGDSLEIIQAEEHFVSNGGYKRSKALKDFEFSVKDKVFIDVGASNGGFT